MESMPRPSLREQILSAGLDVFHRKGFNATSVQEITDAAGAPKGSFYNHFESKEALGAEAVGRYEEKSAALLGFLEDRKVAPLRRLRKYFESLVEAAIEAEFSGGCLLGNFGSEVSGQSSLVRARVGEAFDRWCDQIASVVSQAQKAGAMSRNHPPKAVAEFVIDAWEGALVRAKVEKDRAPLDVFLKMTFSRVLAQE